jgi:hypothetical protein
MRFLSVVRTMSRVPDRFLKRYARWIRSFESSTGPDEFSPILYADAIAVLSDFGVIDRIRPSAPAERGTPPVLYTIHKLTRKMLRALFEERNEAGPVAGFAVSFIAGIALGIADFDDDDDDEYDLGLAIIYALEFLAGGIIDGAGNPDTRAVNSQIPSLVSTLAAALLTTLHSPQLDELHQEFKEDIPYRGYQWAADHVTKHPE